MLTSQTMNSSVPFKLVLFLAGVFALAPFATDSYLPAMPHMANDLNVDTSSIALTVSIYVFSMAIGQLFGGPLCDRIGRRISIILGLALFIIGCFIISKVDTLAYLYAGRVIQAIGGGIAMVCVPAIIRDISTGTEAAKLFTLIGLIMMLAPSIAPSIGTFILNLWGWRWIFISMAGFAAFIAFTGLFSFPKNYRYQRHESSGVISNFIQIFKTREARKYVIIQSITFSLLMIFLTNSSIIYIVGYGVDEKIYSSLFIFITTVNIIINRTNAYLLNKHSPQRLLYIFIGMQLTGVLILVISQILVPENWIYSAVGFVITLASSAGISGNTNACFMSYFSKTAGTASAFMGASQSIISAAIGALSALFLSDNLFALSLLMLTLSLTGFFVANSQKHQS